MTSAQGPYRDAGPKTTRVSLSPRQAVFFVVYSAALLAIAGVLVFETTWGQVLGVALAFGAVVVLIVKLARGSGRAPCPTCGTTLGDLQRSGPNPSVLCDACGELHEGKDRKLWAIEEGRVAPAPLFAAQLPDHFAWPDGCAVCGAPATRQVPVELVRVDLLRSLGRSAALSTVTAFAGARTLSLSMTRAAVDVPHCATHGDGAKLQVSTRGGLDIVFRSLPFMRAFCARNAVRASHLAHYTRSQGPLAALVPRA